MPSRSRWLTAWAVAIAAAVAVRLWNALTGPTMWGYDAWGHVAYVIFVDLYRGVPWADQGWSYFHPPLYYALAASLATFGSGDVLMRGLALIGSAASLGTAGLAALVVHWNAPGRPGLALLGFCAVALLPLHIYVSPMPGNEMFLCLLTAAAAALFVANERRARPGLLTDAATGLLLGLCLLVKFTGLTALIALVAAVLAGPLLSTRPATALPRALARAALIAAVAVAIASPYYARNLQTFGTPFQLSREFSLVAEVERQQPPGERSWRDFVQLSPRLFTQPDPLAPHLIHSVWGTFYVSTWANVFRGTDVAATPALRRRAWRANGAMALLGILPSALALAGAALCARDVWRGRRRAVGIPMLMLAGATLGAYLFFAWILPRWPALRASYMLTASLPFAVFTARGAEAVIQRVTARARVGITAALVATGVGALWVGAESLALPPRADAPATGAVHYYFGEYDAARTVYRRLLAAPYPVPWLDNLAAVELADGGATRARQLSPPCGDS